LEEWVEKAEVAAARLLARAVKDIITGKISPGNATRQDLAQGKTYRYMPPKLQQELRQRLKERQADNRKKQGPSIIAKEVLITTQVFPPEVHPSAVMVEELAKDLTGRGFEVTVAAGFPHHPFGRLYPGFRKKWLKIEKQNGFRVVRGWHLINPGSGLIPRALVMASQCLGYLNGILNGRQPSVVISYGPPLIGPLVSAMIARSCRAQLITVIYDLYPDILVETGHLKNPFLITALRKMENLILRLSHRIVVLSPGFRRTLIEDKGVAPEKVAVIPVWLDLRDIAPRERDNPWRREMKIPPEKFVVLYAGTIGLVSGAEVVLEAARHLESNTDILFLFVGAGYAKDLVEAEVRRTGRDNVRFLPYQPRERLSEVQATADVSLVTLAPGRGRTSVPSKVLGYLAAARPVVAAVDAECDTADLIRNAECGLVAPPGQGEGLAKAIMHLYQSAEDRQIAGQHGWQYFMANFERRGVLEKFLDLVTEMSQRRVAG
jgi:colanic acid biosynthesis glycosyl transferase WcaI